MHLPDLHADIRFGVYEDCSMPIAIILMLVQKSKLLGQMWSMYYEI